MAARGVFPGSFNPPTVAHLAIAEAARTQYGLETLDLVISRRALAKERVEHPRFEHRIEVIRESIAPYSWLEVSITEHQLLVDIARGYDLLIIGADKWQQIQQPEWYGSPAGRDAAMAALPFTAVVPRHGHDHASDEHAARRALTLDDATMTAVSSTRARSGELDLMVPAARRFAIDTGAWIEPDRYDRRFPTRE